MSVASINDVLVHQGMLPIDEIDTALRKAEASVTGDERQVDAGLQIRRRFGRRSNALLHRSLGLPRVGSRARV
jgi:hypothetical protein